MRSLFREYARSLSVDLEYQGLSEELRRLPGEYGPPGGALFLAERARTVLGCAALRPWGLHTGEMKRLYVRASYRGQGLGRALAGRVIAAARAAGYRRLVLDTLPEMREAQALYRALGFVECPAHAPSPVPGTRYFALRLAADGTVL